MRSRAKVGPSWRAALAAAAVAAAGPASAGLGERAEAIAGDRRALQAEPGGAVAHEGYTVERMASPGHAVREFVSPAGVVFGVAWDGISHPDLSRLLASYEAEYRRAAAKPSPMGRRRRRVGNDHVVVETWGHMRSLHGRAYVPALVPPGVTIDAIR
jgi:Protein of unknown function (DUF2844)